MNVKIPAYVMIAHLSKTSSLITLQSFTELLSNTINQYSYGQLTAWIKNLSFCNMKNKDGSESRVLGVWQLKKVLKIDYTMLGWMLLIKHSKLSILSKCLVVEGCVDIKQINQIFMSESIFRLILESSKQLHV